MNNKPQQTAEEKLTDKYLTASFNCTDCDMPYCDIPCTKLSKNEAKECAKIAIDFSQRIVKDIEKLYEKVRGQGIKCDSERNKGQVIQIDMIKEELRKIISNHKQQQQ